MRLIVAYCYNNDEADPILIFNIDDINVTAVCFAFSVSSFEIAAALSTYGMKLLIYRNKRYSVYCAYVHVPNNHSI